MSEHCGYVVKIDKLEFHPQADRLQIATIFGNSVIVGLDTYIGQMGIYFPVDLQLSEDYCRVNDLVRRKDENGNAAGGYLDPGKRNIRAMKLRGEKSDGLFMPITSLAEFCNTSELCEGDTIDVINGVEICCKYIPARHNAVHHHGSGQKKIKKNFAPTFYEHVDTEQLAYHLLDFHHGDTIELTLKMHGTSGRTGYLPLVKQKPQNWLQKLLRRPVQEYKEYGYVTGTRRVVLQPEIENGGYYSDNEFRRQMAYKFEGKLRKGEVVYYEIVGFVNKDTPIMGSVANSKVSDRTFTKQYGKTTVYSYGCDPEGGFEEEPIVSQDGTRLITAPRCEVYVYRMTMVNEDGDVIEYSPDQMRYRCKQMGVKTVPVFERFIIPVDEVNPGEYVLHKVEQYYDGPDPIGKTHVREGVVARIVNHGNAFRVYKHKNFSFKCLESIVKDAAAEPDMEEAQEVIEDA